MLLSVLSPEMHPLVGKPYCLSRQDSKCCCEITTDNTCTRLVFPLATGTVVLFPISSLFIIKDTFQFCHFTLWSLLCYRGSANLCIIKTTCEVFTNAMSTIMNFKRTVLKIIVILLQKDITSLLQGIWIIEENIKVYKNILFYSMVWM